MEEELIISTIQGEKHLGENLKQRLIKYVKSYKELEKKYKIEQLKNVLDEKCLEEALEEMKKDVLKEIEEPINVLINFAVCCSPSLNCDEYCSYNDEDCTCGKLNEDFELRKSVLKLREYFKMKGVNEDEKEN